MKQTIYLYSPIAILPLIVMNNIRKKLVMISNTLQESNHIKLEHKINQDR